ncbi:MAG: acylneuraminate cytidylyltransferase family protein [archaeon]
MIKNKKILAIITARAESKGVPMKNVKPLLNKPLFIWSILAAINSQFVDKIVVSSNCEAVKKQYLKFNKNHNNLYWIQRPDEYATDTSKNEEALIHAYKTMKENINFDSDIIINLQPTSPCRLNNLLDKCIEEYCNGYDSLLTASKDTPFIWQKKHGNWVYNVDKNDYCNRKMRQEFNEDEFIFHDCGNVYMTNSKVLLQKECRIGNNPYIYEVSGINGLQIDTAFDFKLIEKMAEVQNIDTLI